MKLEIKGYKRHPLSLYRILVKNLGYQKKIIIKYKPQKYDTPCLLDEKWQMDTKNVPMQCKAVRTTF